MEDEIYTDEPQGKWMDRLLQYMEGLTDRSKAGEIY